MCYWYYFRTTERKWEEKKAEGTKLRANCGSPCAAEREGRRSSFPSYPANTQRRGLSPQARGQTPPWASDLAAVCLLRRVCCPSLPAAGHSSLRLGSPGVVTLQWQRTSRVLPLQHRGRHTALPAQIGTNAAPQHGLHPCGSTEAQKQL